MTDEMRELFYCGEKDDDEGGDLEDNFIELANGGEKAVNIEEYKDVQLISKPEQEDDLIPELVEDIEVDKMNHNEKVDEKEFIRIYKEQYINVKESISNRQLVSKSEMDEAINELLGEDTDYVDHKDIIQVNNSNKNAYGNEHKENTNNNYLLDDNEREKVIIDGEEYEDYEDDGAFLDNIPITNNSQKNKTSKTSKVKKPMRLEDNKKEILDLTEVVENQQANDIIKEYLEKIPQEIDIKDEELDEILGLNKKLKGNKDISMIEHSYKQYTPKSVTVEKKEKNPKLTQSNTKNKLKLLKIQQIPMHSWKQMVSK